MRLVIWLTVLCLLGLPGVSHAQQSPRKWLRRITLVASCAASAWDIQTTAAAIGRGARESNGLFTDPTGRARWGRMIGFKAGLCGSTIISQELHLFGRRAPAIDNIWIGINSGLATRFTIAAMKNRAVAP